MKRVGLIGWRGMVGSLLMQRMLEEQDFDLIEPVFFTTSNVGGQGPSVGKDIAPLKNAYSIEELKTIDVILTCQGGDYTSEVFPKLREAGWQGYWIDAASSLRMQDDAVIILDPVNRKVIDQQLDAGTKNYVGKLPPFSPLPMDLDMLLRLLPEHRRPQPRHQTAESQGNQQGGPARQQVLKQCAHKQSTQTQVE